VKPERPLKEFVKRRDAIAGRVARWTPAWANALHEILERLASPVDPVTTRPIFTVARDGAHAFEITAFTGYRWMLDIGPAVIIRRQAPHDEYPHVEARYDVLVMDGLEGELRTYGDGDRIVEDMVADDLADVLDRYVTEVLKGAPIGPR
jgi:hypothetical protein